MLLQIFQNAVAELMQDIIGVRNLLDDNIFFGKNLAATDAAFHSTVKRFNEKGVKQC